ncbi:MAG TPA: uroporphyrinogen decarboxylase family protein [Anaerolineales bacterium]|nr:uroporphyrinogen decarboxylase family protein [Anaerolineales bacterium]
MTAVMSSRARMLAALANAEPDHTPCSFMMYGALKSISRDYEEYIDRQVAMGLDAFVELPPRPPIVVNDYYNLHGLPVSYSSGVTISEWVEHMPEEESPILVKEYHTPAGTLRAEVRQTPDWRWGDHVPFLDDYIVPRSRKFLVTKESDLPLLGHLLVPPSIEETTAFARQADSALAIARKHDLLVTGGWGVGADLVGWVCGLQNMMYMVYDRPQLLRALLDLIESWNRKRMEVVLQAGIDLYIKRAWYENLDFWTPSTWREFLYPSLKAEVETAHERGARFGYLITSNCMGLLESIAEAGVDVVVGVDPHAWDLHAAKDALRGRVCLWGGVNGHLTLEAGSADAVRAEVRESLEVLGDGGGFILSPVDNVREDSHRSRENVKALVDEWTRVCSSRPTA